MLTYRKATPGDAEILARTRITFLSEIGAQQESATDMAYLHGQNLRYFAEALGDGSFAAFLAYEGDELVATSGVSFFKLPPNRPCPDGKVAYISNMYTAPHYRGRGIATHLFELTVEEAAVRGHTKLLLNATAMGRPIYEKFGFKDAGSDMVYYIRKEPRP